MKAATPLFDEAESEALLQVIGVSLAIRPDGMSAERAIRIALETAFSGLLEDDGEEQGGADGLTPDAVLERAKPLVRSLARKMVLGREARDDAAQEAYVRIIRRLPQYDPATASIETFCHVVGRSAILDFLRRESRHGRAIASDPEVLAESQAARGTDPQETVERRERGRLATDLRVRIARLLLRGMSKAEIAVAIGCNRDTVREVRRTLRLHGVELGPGRTTSEE